MIKKSIKYIVHMIIDIFNRIIGRQKAVLFSDKYISLGLLSQYKELIDKAHMISKTDAEGKVTFVNNTFLEAHGISEEEIIGCQHGVVKCGITTPEEYKEMWQTLKIGLTWTGLMSYTNKDGKIKHNSVTVTPVFDKNGEIIEFISLRKDISKIIEIENSIEDTQREIIFTLGAIIEGKDGELKQHIEKVSEYSYLVAELLGLSKRECDIIKLTSPLHDVGKIGIHEDILNSPEILTKEEFEAIKTHTTIGFNLLKNSKLELLRISALISKEHHEKWDGTGYPQGLKGEEIHIYGRIVAFADVFDALASSRTYKEAWPLQRIDDYIKDERAKHFDPKIVDLYFENSEKFKEILEKSVK